MLTVPKVIASGESITIPAGRVAILPDVQIDGTLNVVGDVFIPTGTANSKVVQKVTSTDNAIVRFDGVTGDVQNSGVVIDDNNDVTVVNQTAAGLVKINTGMANPIADSRLAQIVIGNTTSTASVRIAGYTDGNWSDGVSSPTSLRLYTTPVGSNAVTERMRIDSAGNVGIGVTPKSSGQSFEISSGGAGICSQGAWNGFSANTYYNNGWKYANNGVANQYEQTGGTHYWKTAPSGTAGNTVTWTTAMSLNASGNLNVGVSGSSIHNFRKSVSLNAGSPILEIAESGGMSTAIFYGVNGWGVSGANTAIKVGKDNVTSRSINAGGTINASGADYAEYEYSNDVNLVKGQIVGFKTDGTLTDKYSEAIRFAIKSTNPSIVGGDDWGTEEIIGKRPEQPVKTKEMSDEEFAKLEEQYEQDLADFEARLEAERQKVDRIAYSGKVPVNVYGAVPGQYVIAVDKDGKIDGKLIDKKDMTFSDYQDAVGRVNKILEDGRCEVAVIIH